MKDYSHIFNAHPSFIESIYNNYLKDPNAVDQDWRLFFEGFDFASAGASSDDSSPMSTPVESVVKEFGVLSIIHGFRSRGHLLSTTNPIRDRVDRSAHLDLSDYGLTEGDLNQVFNAGAEIGMANATLQQIIDRLRIIYCGNLGIEYSHIENREKRTWLRDKIENRKLDNSYGLSLDKKKEILTSLNGAVIFEKFLHTKYIGQKRFSLEGGETTIAALDAVIKFAAKDKVEEVVIGMAHRGRLNVLANILGKTYEQIFNEFEGKTIPDLSFGDGDVKYHLGFSSQKKIDGKTVHLKLVPNPSHLEAVNPVLEGFSRAKADIEYGSDYDKILPILIHGDAAIAGQGVMYEVVQMSQLDGYYTGGTLHYVINNQIGFTTDFEDARSSTYCTAAASLVQAPVFHVNGDDPEATIFAVELAMEYRQKFNNDVFLDMVCYRRHGHNEGDDPKFTQPKMYAAIDEHKNPRDLYVETLLSRGDVDKKLAEDMENEFWNDLQSRLDNVKQNKLPYEYQHSELAWKQLKKTFEVSDLLDKSFKTGISKANVDKVIKHLMELPKDFTPNSKVKRLQKGKQKLLDQKMLDWGFAELLAYGSLIAEGTNVRMSGQDVKRGTFSHRHAVFTDTVTNEQYNRLNGLSKNNSELMIHNSLLSEFAVLGFEYGYAMASPESLVIWEAQFGDFYNGAQSMVDQFIAAGESKWRRMNGVVMLLPHGMEGQGPEHSSARLERFLQLCAGFNLIVANATTPANFFHLLRRQIAMPFRKPLIHMSPKSLLRHPLCVSPISDFNTSSGFKALILDDEIAKPKRILFCSGKIYYDLLEYRIEHKIKDTAIVRIEQLYPFPKAQVDQLMKDNAKAKMLWVQEESANNGAWTYILNIYRRTNLEVVSRPASASPATGFKKVHELTQAELIQEAFGNEGV
jgi:2-oxoglutarate dehydrogenase E1 component